MRKIGNFHVLEQPINRIRYKFGTSLLGRSLGRDADHFARRQLQGILIFRKRDFFLMAFLTLGFFGSLYAWIARSDSGDKPTSSFGRHGRRANWVMAAVGLPTLAVFYASTQFWALWTTLRDYSPFYNVLGKGTHLVVDVSIQPLPASSGLKAQPTDFNLISSAESASFSCKRRHCLPPERKDRKLQWLQKRCCNAAGLSLFAFGTRKDDEESRRWLSTSRKASVDLQNHIRQVEKHERQYESYYTLIFSGHYKYTDLISTRWSHRYQTVNLRLLPKALIRYQDETQGKTNLQNQDLHSLGFLLGTLGDIYMAYCLFDLAADSYREAAKKDFLRSMRKGFVAKISDLSLIGDQRQNIFVFSFAVALNAQGKEAEATIAFKSIKPLSNNPNGKESFWFSKDFTENRNIAGRGLLAQMLLKQQMLHEVTRLDIVNDLRDCLNFRIAESKDIDFCNANVWTFVKALVKSSNLPQAVDMLRRFSAVLATAFGAISPEVLVAKAEMSFVLSLRARLGLDEGLSLLSRLISSFILPEREPTFAASSGAACICFDQRQQGERRIPVP